LFSVQARTLNNAGGLHLYPEERSATMAEPYVTDSNFLADF
jgi:hypothetical protein